MWIVTFIDLYEQIKEAEEVSLVFRGKFLLFGFLDNLLHKKAPRWGLLSIMIRAGGV
jgi:hypothetical protein